MQDRATRHTRPRLITWGWTIAARLGSVALCACGAAPSQAAEPYVPDDPEHVLYELPLALLQQREAVTEARRAWSADPLDVDKACAVAGADLRLGQQTGDPRFYGFARAALQPWWDEPAAPARVLAIRAKLKETDHDFAGAIIDLRELVRQRPEETQAWIELANLNRVRGDYAAAFAAADRLTGFAEPVPVALARIPLLAVTGSLDAADQQLAAIRPTIEADWTGVLPWAVTMQAQIARARGDIAHARSLYLQAMALGTPSGYLRRAYADLLLDEGRYKEVIALTEDHTADTGVLLRAAIAARRSGDEPRATRWANDLDNRFHEIRLRGSEPHGRFEARYTLEILEDPARALEIALENWGKQREQLDSRHVLAAALAARRPGAAAPVIEFLREHGTEDAELEALIRQLEALP